jgi:hypothetical protein
LGRFGFAASRTPSKEAVDVSRKQRQSGIIVVTNPDRTKAAVPAAAAFSSVQPEGSDSTPQPWSSANPQLESLFAVVLQMCLSQTSSEAATAASQLKIQVANRTTLLVLLDLFNEEIRQTRQNLVARRLIRFVFPEVQLFVLKLLVMLHQLRPQSPQRPGAYQLMVDCAVWDVLSGPFFLPTNPESTATILEYMPEEFSREDVAVRSQQISTYLNRELSRYFFEAIEYIAASAKEDNSAELGVLIDICEKHRAAGHLDMCMQGLSSLLRLLQARWLMSVQAMIALNGCARLASLLTYLVDRSTNGPEEERPMFVQCRNVCLRCVNLLLSSPTSLPAVMADGITLDVLFKVLLDKDLRTFALTHVISIMKSESGFIKANQELFFKLFERYLDTMLKEHTNPTPDTAELPTLLLNGLATILDLKDCLEQQNLFCSAGAFIKITSMIHITPGKAEEAIRAAGGGRTLCLSVLRALTSLMADNEENKDFFAKHIGYDQLKELILISFNHTLPRLLLTSLLDLMLDGKLSMSPRVHESDDGTGDVFAEPNEDGAAISAASVSTLRNPSIASLLLKVILYFEEKDQQLLMDFMAKLASHSSLNRTRLCTENVLFQLLEMIPENLSSALVEKIANLIKLLGQHSITVREANKLISLLKPLTGDLRVRNTIPPDRPNVTCLILLHL